MFKSQSLLGVASLFIAAAVCLFALGAVVMAHHWVFPEHPGHGLSDSLTKSGATMCLAVGVALVGTLFQRWLVVWACIVGITGLTLVSWFGAFVPGLGAVDSVPRLPGALVLSLLFVIAACAAVPFKGIRRLICTVAGAALLAVSTLSFLSFWFDALSWFSQTRHDNGQLSISPIGALIGIALMQLPVVVSRIHAVPARSLLTIAATGCLLTAICWHGVDMQQARKHLISQELAINTAVHAIETWHNQQESLIGRLAERWEALPAGAEERLWQAETTSYFRDLDSLKGLATLDANMQLSRFAVAEEVAADRLKAALADRGFLDLLKRAADTQQTHMSRFRPIDDDVGYLFVAVPIAPVRSEEAFVIAVMDPVAALNKQLAGRSFQGGLRIEAAGRTLFSTEPAGAQSVKLDAAVPPSLTAVTETVIFHDLAFQVTANTHLHLRTHWDTYLPAFILLSGLSLTLLVMVYRFLAFTTSRQEQRLRKTYAKLTETLHEERRLRATHEKIHRYSKDLLCSIDSQDRFTTMNPACWELLGYRPEEMLGRYYQDFLVNDDRTDTARERESILAGRASANFRNRYRHKGGAAVTLMWSAEWSEADQSFFCVARDVSALEEAERLRKERDTFFALTPEMLCILGLDSRLYQANDAFLKTLGYSLDELKKCSSAELFDPRELSDIEAVSSRLANGEEIQGQAIRVRNRSGQWLWLEYSAVQRNGVIYCAARDITEARDIQQQLVESQSLLKIAEDTANIGGWVVDLPSGELTWSDAVCRIHEVPIGTKPAVGEALRYYVPSCRGEIEALVESAIRDGTPFDGEFQIRTAKNNLRWVRSIGSVLTDARGEAKRVQGAFQDITEARIANDKIKRLANRLQTTFESITDAFFTLDLEWRFTFLNPQAERLLQRSSADLVGKSIWREFPGSVGSEFDERYHRAVESQSAVTFEASYSPLDDWFEVSAYPSDEGLAVYFRSVKERKLADAKLHATMRELERSNAELESFAYVSSHDLQEPLRKIQTFSDRLLQQSGQFGDRERDYLKRMQSAAGRMQALIRGLLAYSRVSTHARPFAVIDLGLVVDEASRDLDAAVEEAGATITMEELPEVEGDDVQLRQLFQNLFSNSLKFRAPGVRPEISIKRVSETAEQVTVEVQDNGVGFDQRYANRIFEPFHRLHHRDHYEGTGIGLSIVRKILNRHRASVAVESKANVGTTFRLTFPKRQSTFNLI